MTIPRAILSPSGDSSLRVVAQMADREAGWRLIHHLARHLDEARVPGVIGSIPTYDALLIELDPLDPATEGLERSIGEIVKDLDIDRPLTTQPRTFRVPVLYGGEFTADLERVASDQGLSVSQVIHLHSEPKYVVRCLGAPGGSPMLDGPALPKPVPRLSSPRAAVPQGVVSLAGRQATITPAAAPGGWALLGRTPLRILDLSAEPFVPYVPGDFVTFHPIGEQEFEALRGRRMEPE